MPSRKAVPILGRLSICFNFKFVFIVCIAAFLSNNWSNTATADAAVATLPPTQTPPTPRECGSIDCRNDCASLLQLQGCTVIKGFLKIVLLPRTDIEMCDFEQYRFPLLREITDFFIFYDVRGLKEIRNMFPNLTVIRGRRLFLNYAVGITGMPDLETLEFRSLVAIQRGHVFISTNPKLCQLEKINWGRLTLSTGKNNIFPVTPQLCPEKSLCNGCDIEYCWSNLVCQKFQNDNVVNPVLGAHHCDEECLGGCYNNTCVVCKGLTDHNKCVKKCPEDKYTMERYQRCYSKEECVEEKGQYIHESFCVTSCPKDFTSDNNSNCVPCKKGDDCRKICQPESRYSDIATIYNMDDADYYKGCHIINGSMVIAIRTMINELDLMRSFETIREIRGYLKIYRSAHITSLKFLQNLRKIFGNPLEHDLYSFIIYENKNLKNLWTTDNFELESGSMFVHLNNKLCSRFVREFSEKVIHDKTFDSLQTSDQEVLCGPSKLLLQVEVLSLHNLKLTWRRDQTSDQIEIIYRPIPHSEVFLEESELDSNVCTRINWQRQLVFRSELLDNGTHHFYTITGLEQNTRYGCLVKTFGAYEKFDSRSKLVFVTMQLDIPKPPAFNITEKNDTSLTLQLIQPDILYQVVDYYVLEVYEHTDYKEFLDKRNYCEQPPLSYQEHEDYDDCCARVEEEAEDRLFITTMQDKFSCSLDRHHNCFTEVKLIKDNILHSQRLELNMTTYTLYQLETYRQYDFQIKACNSIGCSSFSIRTERTSYYSEGNTIDDVRACLVSGTMEHQVQFNEPKYSNGLIINYFIHYRVPLSGVQDYQVRINCVTRLQHYQSRYKHVAHFNMSFNQVQVHVHSLGRNYYTPWVDVTPCLESTAKMAGNADKDSKYSHGFTFLIFFVVLGGGTLTWVFYKRRCWRKLSGLRRHFRGHIRHLNTTGDEAQILVDGFNTVHFLNNSNE